jgi:LIVCS family branched-chain amino acid:cation transporter
MIFSMFFGAGNLIFPPQLGQLAGTNMLTTMGGFLISAVGLPILAVAVVAKAGGLDILTSRVHPRFAFAFTVLIYLSIGPFLGIPRAASLAFEMGISPFLSNSISGSRLPLFIYSLIYFGIAFWLCLSSYGTCTF